MLMIVDCANYLKVNIFMDIEAKNLDFQVFMQFNLSVLVL